MKELYVVNCCRTAIGSFGGSLKNTPAVDMGAIVVKEALKRANVAPENVDELMFGCILTAGQGQNPARQVSVKAGIPYSVPAYTVGMVCGSGMKSVIEGARSILAGDSDIVVCGGTENMSAAPYTLPDERWGARMSDKKVVDEMIKDGLWDAFNNYHMGTTAENINDIWGITRREQDEFAAASQQKACAARDSGRFDDQAVIFQLSFRFKGQNVRAVLPHGVHAAAEPTPQTAPLHAIGQCQQLRVHFFGDGLHHPFGIPRSGIVNAEYIPHVFTSVSYASPAASLSSSQRRYRASSSAWAASLSATSALSFS